MAAQFAARNGGKVSAATRRTLAKTVKMETEDFKPNVKREQGGDDDDLFGDGDRKRDGDQVIKLPTSPTGCASAYTSIFSVCLD